jgi:serine/threonine-protein kinase
VLQQSISPNERVREGRSVGVVVSKGPRPRTVPRLVGLEARAVPVVLGSGRLKVRRSVRSCSETVPEGSVIAQEPKPGQSMTADAVDLLVSTGACFDRFLMENFVGAAYRRTAQRLQEKGFSVGFTKEETGESEEGLILAQEPAQGALVSARESLQFTVASRTAASPAKESRLVFYRVSSPPAFFRKVGSLRLVREEPFGSATIDFLMPPGNNSEFVLWLSQGSELVVTVNGEEIVRKTYPWL